VSFPLVALLAVGLLILVLRIARRLRKPNARLEARFGIPMTKGETQEAQQNNDEVMVLLEEKIRKSGFFKTDKIPEVLADLKRDLVPFGRISTRTLTDGDVYLSAKEKRALGLNTRMKYAKKFIDYFGPESFKKIEPKSEIESMYFDAFHRVSRRNELHKLKALGFVRRVKIVPVGDMFDCAKIKRLKKVYEIETVPELPLPDCDSSYCRCFYEAVIPERW
jgi:hypothetical protein